MYSIIFNYDRIKFEKKEVKMKNFILVFLVIFILLFTGCAIGSNYNTTILPGLHKDNPAPSKIFNLNGKADNSKIIWVDDNEIAIYDFDKQDNLSQVLIVNPNDFTYRKAIKNEMEKFMKILELEKERVQFKHNKEGFTESLFGHTIFSSGKLRKYGEGSIKSFDQKEKIDYEIFEVKRHLTSKLMIRKKDNDIEIELQNDPMYNHSKVVPRELVGLQPREGDPNTSFLSPDGKYLIVIERIIDLDKKLIIGGLMENTVKKDPSFVNNGFYWDLLFFPSPDWSKIVFWKKTSSNTLELQISDLNLM